jgi:hypothetical protein
MDDSRMSRGKHTVELQITQETLKWSSVALQAGQRPVVLTSKPQARARWAGPGKLYRELARG